MHSCCAFVHRKPQQEGTEVAVTPLPATAPPNSYTNFAFDGATAESNRENIPVSASSGTSNDNDYVNVEQLSSPSVPAAVADAVAGTDNGHIIYQPTVEYERLSYNHRNEPAYETPSGNKPKPAPRPRLDRINYGANGTATAGQ